MSLQALVIDRPLGPPAPRARQPYCPQPHGVVVTAEACLAVGLPEPSPRLFRMEVFTKCTLISLSNAANPQPGDFTQEKSGCQKGNLEAWAPALSRGPTGSALVVASAAGPSAWQRGSKRGSDVP